MKSFTLTQEGPKGASLPIIIVQAASRLVLLELDNYKTMLESLMTLLFLPLLYHRRQS